LSLKSGTAKVELVEIADSQATRKRLAPSANFPALGRLSPVRPTGSGRHGSRPFRMAARCTASRHPARSRTPLPGDRERGSVRRSPPPRRQAVQRRARDVVMVGPSTRRGGGRPAQPATAPRAVGQLQPAGWRRPLTMWVRPIHGWCHGAGRRRFDHVAHLRRRRSGLAQGRGARPGEPPAGG
jgi:hypothetical protein